MIKIQPICPVFAECGGCQYQDISYEDELRLKEEQLKGFLRSAFDLTEDVFHSILASPQELPLAQSPVSSSLERQQQE